MNEKIKEIRFDTKRAQCFFQELLAYTLGPIELKDLIDEGKVNLVDVRRFEDYEVSHIPGAISIPKEELADNTNKLSKEEITVVYCYNEQCHLGIEACLILVEYGYPAMLLEGGFRTWTEDFRFATTN